MYRSLSSTGRPRTPPNASSHKGRSGTPPLTKTTSNLASPPRRNYSDYLSHTNNDWTAEEEDEEEDDYSYENDDGDDFGLPSISNLRRKKSKRIAVLQTVDPGGGLSPWRNAQNPAQLGLGPRRLSNSADIAIERPVASYPTPKKSEGKILRPQYKEILRGRFSYARFRYDC